VPQAKTGQSTTRTQSPPKFGKLRIANTETLIGKVSQNSCVASRSIEAVVRWAAWNRSEPAAATPSPSRCRSSPTPIHFAKYVVARFWPLIEILFSPTLSAPIRLQCGHASSLICISRSESADSSGSRLLSRPSPTLDFRARAPSPQPCARAGPEPPTDSSACR
jgi:hypothetical protein